MELIRMILGGLLVIGVWGAVHYYLGRHLVGTLTRTRHAARIAWGVIALHGVLAPILMMIRRGMPQGVWYHALNFVVYTGMGFVALLFVLFVVRDLSAWAARRWVHKVVDEDRRAFLTSSFNLGAFVTTGVATGVGLHNAIKVPDVKEVEVLVPGLAPGLDGLRVAQLSDLHIGPTLRGKWLEAVVERTNSLGADLVAITGDLVDARVSDMGHEVASLGQLKSTYGTFFVTGNHDYYWNGPEWVEHVESLGVRALINSHALIERQGGRLLVGGVTDLRTGRMAAGHSTDPFKAIANAPQHDFSLLLAHQPGSVYDAAKAGWKMQISGHTHGGQFFPWNFVVGIVHEFYAGLGKHLDTLIYVSRGTGFWGPPNRTVAPSEITLLTLKSAGTEPAST